MFARVEMDWLASQRLKAGILSDSGLASVHVGGNGLARALAIESLSECLFEEQ
jgi:hypothetical protein